MELSPIKEKRKSKWECLHRQNFEWRASGGQEVLSGGLITVYLSEGRGSEENHVYCMDVGMEPRSKICKASILYHKATSLYQHAQSKLPSLLLFSLPLFSTQHLVATKGPYLSVFLIRMALKMCSKGDFSCLGVGCRKGCRATSENPCWYSSRSWAGKSFKEVSLTAEECGSSARVERGETYQGTVKSPLWPLSKVLSMPSRESL